MEIAVLEQTCRILKKFDIDAVYPSTGLFIDDYIDNSLAAIKIQENTKLKTICNGNIFNQKQYDNLKGCDFFGIAVNSIDVFNRLKL
jgi:hypothetical protein